MGNNNKSSTHFVAGLLCGTVVSGIVYYSWLVKKWSVSMKVIENIDYERKSHDQGKVERILPSEFRQEQLSRNELFFGSVGVESIARCRVVVVGVGGVGSHAATMLARGGVGYIRLIDFDQVTLSSLNRHACATLEDVGKSKVGCLKSFLDRICGGHCIIDAQQAMYTAKDQETLLSDGPFDFIVDCIDDVTTKVELLEYCARTKTKVITCMGAGGKSDVTRVHIGDLTSACHDALATKMRVMLKRRKVSFDGDLISVVYSSEKVVAPLAELTEEQKNSSKPSEFGAVDTMRVRVLPVLGTMPAIMGQAMAAFVLCETGDKPFSPLSGERMGRGVRHRVYQHLKNREKDIRTRIERQAGIHIEDSVTQQTDNTDHSEDTEQEEDMRGTLIHGTWVGPCQVDGNDVEYLMAEVWRMRCAVTHKRMGVVLELTRWDLSLPSVCGNLVLMSKGIIAKLDEANNNKDFIPIEIQQQIERRLAWSKVDAWS